jgi:hypothetical protein
VYVHWPRWSYTSREHNSLYLDETDALLECRGSDQGRRLMRSTLVSDQPTLPCPLLLKRSRNSIDCGSEIGLEIPAWGILYRWGIVCHKLSNLGFGFVSSLWFNFFFKLFRRQSVRLGFFLFTAIHLASFSTLTLRVAPFGVIAYARRSAVF